MNYTVMKHLYAVKYLILCLCCICYGGCPVLGQQPRIIIDADTGNSIDDLYAIAYLLQRADIQPIALTAAHFNNPDLLTYRRWNGYSTRNIRTMRISHRVNKKLVKAAGKHHKVRCVAGAPAMIGRAWGGTTPRPSAASRLIIEEAMKLSGEQKLVIIALGPLTNVASAIIEQPGIAHHLVVYAMGADYDKQTHVWNKAEFNVRNDLNAFDYLLNTEVEMHIMPASIAQQLVFERVKTQLRLKQAGGKLPHYLSDRWKRIGHADTWSMWDLALAVAYTAPSLATEEQVMTPPENKQRKIWVYTGIDAPAMEAAFWLSFLSE